MNEHDYTAHLLMHVIDDNDTVNAKFLFQRVPEAVAKKSKTFVQVWNAVKALSLNNSGAAIDLLSQPFAAAAATSPGPLKDKINVLREIAVWHLSEHVVPQLISAAYSNIEVNKVREMLGQASNFEQIVSSTGLFASAQADAQGFVEVLPRQT